MDKSAILSGGYEGRRTACIDLGQRYGEIGISAVAAAVRYQSQSKHGAEARNEEPVKSDKAA